MPTSRRFRSMHPIHSEKRENTWSNLIQDASTVKVVTILDTVDSPTSAAQCSVGSHVKWIYFETNLNGVDNSGATSIFHWMIYKSPQNQLGSLDPATYDQVTKRWVMKRGMEMLPAIPIGSGGTVQTKRIFVVKIPKSFQRMADGDRIVLTYKNTSASAINYCGFTILKYIQ